MLKDNMACNGSVSFERDVYGKGERQVWLATAVANRPPPYTALCGPFKAASMRVLIDRKGKQLIVAGSARARISGTPIDGIVGCYRRRRINGAPRNE
jgi:hypothetical protein